MQMYSLHRWQSKKPFVPRRWTSRIVRNPQYVGGYDDLRNRLYVRTH